MPGKAGLLLFLRQTTVLQAPILTHCMSNTARFGSRLRLVFCSHVELLQATFGFV